MIFLLEHANLDMYHNKLMERYLDGLVLTESDISSVIYTMRGTAKVYAGMLASAFEQAEHPIDWGVDSVEAARYEMSKLNNDEDLAKVA